MRFLRTIVKVLPGIIAAIFIGTILTLLIAFPRVINELADVMSTQPTNIAIAAHWLIAFIIDVLLIYIAIILPWRRVRETWDLAGLIVKRGPGRAYMDVESVRQQVYAAVVHVPDIQHTEVAIENKEGRAKVTIDVISSPAINAPRKKANLRREIHKVLINQLGIHLAGEPIITIHLASLPADIPSKETKAAIPAIASTPVPTPAPTPLPTYPSEPITPPKETLPETPSDTTPSTPRSRLFGRPDKKPTTEESVGTPTPTAEIVSSDEKLNETGN